MSALDCGHAPTPPTSFHPNGMPLTNGTATDSETGRTMCYACADAAQRAQLADPATLVYSAYISTDGKKVTTWTGGELARVDSYGKTGGGFGGTQHHVRATAPDGSQWYGRNGGPGMYVNLKRKKVAA